MTNQSGNTEATRKGIANVFAEFYKDSHYERKDKKGSEAGLGNTCDHPDDDIEDDEQDRHFLEFTRTELMIASDSLKKGN